MRVMGEINLRNNPKLGLDHLNYMLSKKRAISTVLTTVIILVSSVVLGSGVVLYGTSLFQGSTQTEAIRVADVKLWVHESEPEGVAWGGAFVRNSGDKVVAIDKISVRGTDIPFSQWYADVDVSVSEFQHPLNHTGWTEVNPGQTGPRIKLVGACVGNNSYLCVDLDGEGSGTDFISANATTGPISFGPGEKTVIYFKANNGTYTPLDSGTSTTVSLFAGKAGGPFAVIVKGLR